MYQANDRIIDLKSDDKYIYLIENQEIVVLNQSDLKKKYSFTALGPNGVHISKDNLTYFSDQAFFKIDLIQGKQTKIADISGMSPASNAVKYRDGYLFLSQQGELVELKLES